MFIWDIAGGDIVGWIDRQLSDYPGSGNLPAARAALVDPLRHVYGISDKVIAMALATLLMGAGAMPHLPAPLRSPIAKRLHTADLVTNKNKHVIRRGGVLFDEALINHNVYTAVDGIIRANEAVFDAKPHAPQQLIDAVGIIEDDLFRVQNWRGLLNKNRLLLEDAVGFKAGKDVL